MFEIKKEFFDHAQSDDSIKICASKNLEIWEILFNVMVFKLYN